ncbi:proton-coupled zinc antiporter SLC30A2-like isoform X2 [Dysidea avara]|uniref:proton-coupled zinc antiporter SLC30A2-like isoform X2 n=1 Tax=Dysidea avara TaxID=196820 RepID=UPI003320ECC6
MSTNLSMTDEDLEMDERVNKSSTSLVATTTTGGVQQSTPTDDFMDLPQAALPNFRRHNARNRYDKLKEETRCLCHEKPKQPADRKARNRLIAACIIVFVFMIGEIVGGKLANSLAIMTDAAHMLSDFASFLISLFALWMANRPATQKMSFGYYRAEVVGAVISVLVIWVVTGILVYLAVLRILNQDYTINADIMLITAGASVAVNVFMILVLHQHSHHHHHGHGNNHQHTQRQPPAEAESRGAAESNVIPTTVQVKKSNINVRAAFIHVIGDLFQSIGVVIAAYIIRFKPEWHIADPICTFLFSILVLISTLNIMRDAMNVLMEGTPRNIDYAAVLEDLSSIEGVRLAHSLYIWSLTLNNPALAAHLAVDSDKVHFQTVIDQASEMLRTKYNIVHSTVQVEDYQQVMDLCQVCQTVPSTGMRWLPCWS